MAALPHPDGPAQTAVTCAVITVSDTRSPATDKSGALMQSLLTSAGHQVAHYQLVSDEPTQINNLLQDLAAHPDIQVILLNGGTGIAPRDITYDVVAALLEKELPGFGEIFRQLSYAEIGSRAIASRAVAGVYARTLIFSLPGSSKAVDLAMNALILPELVHLTHLLQA